MDSFCKWFRLLMVTLLLVTLAWAQSPQLGAFFDQFEGLVSRRDYNGAAKLV